MKIRYKRTKYTNEKYSKNILNIFHVNINTIHLHLLTFKIIIFETKYFTQHP